MSSSSSRHIAVVLGASRTCWAAARSWRCQIVEGRRILPMRSEKRPRTRICFWTSRCWWNYSWNAFGAYQFAAFVFSLSCWTCGDRQWNQASAALVLLLALGLTMNSPVTQLIDSITTLNHLALDLHLYDALQWLLGFSNCHSLNWKQYLFTVNSDYEPLCLQQLEQSLQLRLP